MTSPHVPKVAGIEPAFPAPAHTAAPTTPDARPVAELSDLQDRLASWVSDLTTLHELTEQLTRTSTLDTALRELLRAGAALVGARRGLVTLEPPDGLGPDLTIGLGLGPADIGHLETVPRRAMPLRRILDGLPGTTETRRTTGVRDGGSDPYEGGAAKGRDVTGTARATPAEIAQPDIAGEPDLDPRLREVAARLGYAASYAVPLGRGAPVTGALEARTARPESPGSDGPTATGPVTSGFGTVDLEPVERPADGLGAGDGAGSVGAEGDSPVAYGSAPGALGAPERRIPGNHGTQGTDAAEVNGDASPATDDRSPAGARLGVLADGPVGAAVWLYDEPAEPTERQRHLISVYCAYATEHLTRLVELHRARRTEATLREELLPSRLPRAPGVRLAVRHAASPMGGGDWYDALPLPDGALGLAVGSVTGSGPSAVAAMGRLRASLRAYAVMEGEDPVAVLSDLELLLRLTEPARSATALFAFAEPPVADPLGGPATRKIVLAGAGHCPPLIVGDRRTEFVETSLSAPLGMLACWEAPSMDLEPLPGETLLFYSDGLLHRTGEPVDRAFARLHAAAAGLPKSVRQDPEAVVDQVLQVMLPQGLSDDRSPEDVVLLAVHFEG